MDCYNKIIKEIYGENFVSTREKIIGEDGFYTDFLHWGKNEHKVVSEILMKKIHSSFKLKESVWFNNSGYFFF